MAIQSLKRLHKKTSILLWVLNLSDLAFTLMFVGNKWATEGNPMLGYFLDHSVWAFVAAKMGVSTLGVFVLSKYPEKDVAVLGTTFLCGIYASLFFFQAYMAIAGIL